MRAKDSAGNFGPFSGAFTFTLDTVIPTAPSITSPIAGTQNTDITEISGTSGGEGLTIEVFDATLGTLGTTTSTADGAWTLILDPDLGEGSYSLTATATDAATNP